MRKHIWTDKELAEHYKRILADDRIFKDEAAKEKLRKAILRLTN